MKTAIMFLLLSSPAIACDWAITSDKTDPMTDQRVCIIRSDSANLALGVRAGEVTFLTGSTYRKDHLVIRVDNEPAIRLRDNGKSTGNYWDDARRAMAQIETGDRIRVEYSDYPHSISGDAPICNLPELIRSCQSD